MNFSRKLLPFPRQEELEILGCVNNWFIHTKLYKNNLESFVKGQGMTWKTKIKIMIMVTILMSLGFVMMDQVPVGRIVLGFVWLFHILYFIFGVKNYKIF